MPRVVTRRVWHQRDRARLRKAHTYIVECLARNTALASRPGALVYFTDLDAATVGLVETILFDALRRTHTVVI